MLVKKWNAGGWSPRNSYLRFEVNQPPPVQPRLVTAGLILASGWELSDIPMFKSRSM